MKPCAVAIAVFVVCVGCVRAERVEKCGNGRVDPGEECDRNAPYALDCPGGWGMCFVCNDTCDDQVLRWPSGDAPFCEVRDAQGALLIKYEFDSRARVSISEYHRDGRVDFRQRFGYDGRGNVSLRETDGEADGDFESRTIYRYDDRGRVAQVESDWDGDGRVQAVCHFYYDEQGALAREERVYLDTGWRDEKRKREFFEELDASRRPSGESGKPPVHISIDHDAIRAEHGDFKAVQAPPIQPRINRLPPEVSHDSDNGMVFNDACLQPFYLLAPVRQLRGEQQ